MSSTQDGLQKSLDALNEFCKKWKLNINHKKTKCITFSKGSNTKKDNFTIDSKNIANTKVSIRSFTVNTYLIFMILNTFASDFITCS